MSTKIEIAEFLQTMCDIEKEIPLSLESDSDGRYTWPERWRVLFDKFYKQEKENTDG